MDHFTWAQSGEIGVLQNRHLHHPVPEECESVLRRTVLKLRSPVRLYLVDVLADGQTLS